MRLFLVAFAASLATALVAFGGDKGWTDISIDELETAIKDGKAAVFDNNPKAVWEKRRVTGAKWLNAKAYTAEDLPADKAQLLVFYCMNDH
jgi:hypothetical protein